MIQKQLDYKSVVMFCEQNVQNSGMFLDTTSIVYLTTWIKYSKYFKKRAKIEHVIPVTIETQQKRFGDTTKKLKNIV